MSYGLIEIEKPNFGSADIPPAPGFEEFKRRIDAVRARMKTAGLTHLVVYADREHFGNLHYLTNFDPRFEEAILILNSADDPLLLVGNECEARLPISPLFNKGFMRGERYQPFSLISQPRDSSRQITDIFKGEGIDARSKVGCVGWKYFENKELPGSAHAIEIPAFLVDALREITAREQVVNATAIFMNPKDGLRTRATICDIVYFEYANILASDGVMKMIRCLRDGIKDFEVAGNAGYNGLALSCHLTMATAENRPVGLTSPIGSTIHRGEFFSTNLAYWGSNTSRCGWVAEDASELPGDARDYVENFVVPYMEALNVWFESLTIGTRGGDIYALMMEKLPYEKYKVFLNPGHLIHLDEWVSSPVYKGSTDCIASGMVMQADIIPSNSIYKSTRMEDGYLIADTALQSELRKYNPDCLQRCLARRSFMRKTLGLNVPDEVLPLSNMAGIIIPFLLCPNRVIGLLP